jgi:hypothetical protein
MTEVREILKYWTPTEVAECLNVGADLYSKLWDLEPGARAPRGPWDEPESEFPEPQEYGWWDMLTSYEQELVEIAYAQYVREFEEEDFPF